MRDDVEKALPRYTRWAQVPAGLYTRTQMGRLDPSRRLVPGAAPRAQALYHGNRYAELFHLDDTVVKPPVSPAQRTARQEAARMLRPATVAAAVVAEADGWLGVALVAAGGETLGCWVVDPHGPYEDRAAVLVAVYEALERAGALHSKTTPVDPPGSTWTHEWDDVVFWSTDQQRSVHRLGVADPVLDARSANPDNGDGWPDYTILDEQQEQWRRTREAWPWLIGLGGTVQARYARWWGEYTETGNALPVSLRWDVPLPGAGGVDAVVDAWALLAVLRGVADGTAAVAPNAPWHGVSVDGVGLNR